jgi:hypothetical protein
VRAPTSIPFVLLAAVAMFGPGLVILRIPLVPNWPYVGLVCVGVSVLTGGAYAFFMRRHLKRPTPISRAWLFRVFPLWLAVFSLFWSYVRLTTEEYRCLEFSQGRVVEKYRSQNHGYLSARVEVAGRGTLACEGLSPASWDAVSTGSSVGKRCGSTDITILRP